MKKLNQKETLPQNLIINSAENNLYRIGLCLTSRNPLNRNKWHNPLLIFSINLIVLIKVLVSLLLTVNHQNCSLIIGDVLDILQIRIHAKIFFILILFLAISSQLIYYYNYKNDIKPTFLKVFEMMSGLVSPQSIGLTNEEQIYKLIKLTKKLFCIYELFVSIGVPLLVFTFSIYIYITNCSVMDIIILGIPNSLIYTLSFYYIYSINAMQVIYLYIILLLY